MLVDHPAHFLTAWGTDPFPAGGPIHSTLYLNDLLGLRVAMLDLFWTCPFPSAACNACCALGWAATSCLGT